MDNENVVKNPNDEEKEKTPIVEESKQTDVAENSTDSTNNAEDTKPVANGNTESNDALATRKFAEGSKKKEKEILSLLGVASIDEAVALINNAKEQSKNYDVLASKSICVDLDVKKEYRDDVIAIVKGKGLAITEENVKAIVDKHPDWVIKADESDTSVVKIGNASGKGQPEPQDERELARKLFR